MTRRRDALLQGRYYSLGLGPSRLPAPPASGRPEPPEDDPERERESYRRWLERARPALDGYFDELARDPGLPLARFGARTPEEVAGAVIDDQRPAADDEASNARFRAGHRGGPVIVRLRGSDLMPAGESLELCILITGRVPRARVEPILRQVAALVIDARQEPPGEEPPAPGRDVPAARPLARRLRDWLRRPSR